MQSSSSANSRLSAAYFISSYGDWFAYFALVAMAYSASGSVAKGALVIAFKSLGVGVGSIVIPPIIRMIGAKKSILVSLGVCSLLFFGLYFYSGEVMSLSLIYSLCFLESLFQQIFEGARETLSKTYGAGTSQRSVQAELSSAFYGGQFFGPLSAVLLLYVIPYETLFLLDAISFLIAAIWILPIPDSSSPIESVSVFSPIKYLKSRSNLKLLLLIRGFLYWIPVSISNLLLFRIMTDHFHFEITETAYYYSITGLGSLLAATWLRFNKRDLFGRLKSLGDGTLAFFALFIQGILRFPFMWASTFPVAAIAIFLSGTCNGIAMVCSQSIRREITSDSEFPEILGLEKLSSKIFEWGFSALTVLLVDQWHVSTEFLFGLSGISLSALSFLYLSKHFKIQPSNS